MRLLSRFRGTKATGPLLVAACLAVTLAAGCTADEPAETTPPVANPDTVTEPEATATPGAGLLPRGATHSVAAVVGSPIEGQQVVLGGEIIEMSGPEDFILSDGTGEVFVDGDNDFLPLAVGDQLLVTGTVSIEDSPDRVEIQATAVKRD